MTTAFERTRSLIQAKEFLLRLCKPNETPRVPRSIRAHAEMLLRHYPSYSDIDHAHRALPLVFGPVPPFSRMRATAQTEAVVMTAKSANPTDTTPSED